MASRCSRSLARSGPASCLFIAPFQYFACAPEDNTTMAATGSPLDRAIQTAQPLPKCLATAATIAGGENRIVRQRVIQSGFVLHGRPALNGGFQRLKNAGSRRPDLSTSTSRPLRSAFRMAVRAVPRNLFCQTVEKPPARSSTWHCMPCSTAANWLFALSQSPAVPGRSLISVTIVRRRATSASTAAASAGAMRPPSLMGPPMPHSPGHDPVVVDQAGARRGRASGRTT